VGEVGALATRARTGEPVDIAGKEVAAGKAQLSCLLSALSLRECVCCGQLRPPLGPLWNRRQRLLYSSKGCAALRVQSCNRSATRQALPRSSNAACVDARMSGDHHICGCWLLHR
jgi:hypothetical protein